MNDTPGWASPGSAPSDGQEPDTSGTAQPTEQPSDQGSKDQPDTPSKWSKEQPPPGQWSAPSPQDAAPGQAPPPPPPGPGWGGQHPGGPGGSGGQGGYGGGGYGSWGGQGAGLRRSRWSRRLGRQLGRPAARGQARRDPAPSARRRRDPRRRGLHDAYVLAHRPRYLADRRGRHADRGHPAPGLRPGRQRHLGHPQRLDRHRQ